MHEHTTPQGTEAVECDAVISEDTERVERSGGLRRRLPELGALALTFLISQQGGLLQPLTDRGNGHGS